MSNRRRPRNPDLHVVRFVVDVDAALANLDAHRCPDCNSEFGEIVRHGVQLVEVQVRHDATCPWWRAAVAR